MYLIMLVAVRKVGSGVQQQHVSGAQPHIAHVRRDLAALHHVRGCSQMQLYQECA